MRVAKLCITPCSNCFIIPFFFMKELVAIYSTHAGKETKNKGELEIFASGLRFQLEPSVWNIYLITNDNKSPNPGDGFHHRISIKWQPESFVVCPRCLAFCGYICVVSFRSELVYWGEKIHQPNRQHEVACIHVYNVRKDKHKSR